MCNDIKPLWLIVFFGVLCQKREAHVNTVEPDLPGINLFVPVTTGMSFRVFLQLLNKLRNGFFITWVIRSLCQREQIGSRANQVDVVFLHVVTFNLATAVDQHIN